MWAPKRPIHQWNCSFYPGAAFQSDCEPPWTTGKTFSTNWASKRQWQEQVIAIFSLYPRRQIHNFQNFRKTRFFCFTGQSRWPHCQVRIIYCVASLIPNINKKYYSDYLFWLIWMVYFSLFLFLSASVHLEDRYGKKEMGGGGLWGQGSSGTITWSCSEPLGVLKHLLCGPKEAPNVARRGWSRTPPKWNRCYTCTRVEHTLPSQELVFTKASSSCWVCTHYLWAHPLNMISPDGVHIGAATMYISM